MIKRVNYKRDKKILSLALPAALNSLLDMLQIITDLIMVGRISPFAVAAVGLGLQSLTFVFALLTMFQVGTSALLSRFVGSSRVKQGSLALSSLFRFALYTSFIVATIWYFIAPSIYIWFNTDSEVIALGSEYVKILTWMLPFIFIKMVFITALSSAGDTKTPFLVKLFSIFLNIFLNWVFIYGNLSAPALGVEGAAIATVIVNILEFCIYLFLYIGKKTLYIPMWNYSAFLVHRALKVGIPASVERTLTFGSFMLFTMIIADFGTEVLAGYQIGLRIEGLAFMPGIGFTIAAMALMGQALGAKDPDMARDDVLLILKYTVAFMSVLALFMIFTPQPIVKLFSDDPQTIKEASLYLQIVGFSQIPLAFNFVLSGALRGAGDTKRTLKINLLSLWLVRIIPAFLAAYYFESIFLVYLAMISDTFVKSIFLWRAFNKGAWREIRV